MRMMLFAALICASPALAEWRVVEQAAQSAFARMPPVVEVSQIAGRCGADGSVNRAAVYCTSENRIYLTRGASGAAYRVAHLLGHAVQVQHGVADRALAAIRRDRAQEFAIRSVVVAQVECLAGVFVKRADMTPGNWFGAEPFTGAHWGRDPLRRGPKVSVGAQARKRAFSAGYDGGVGVCDAIGKALAEGVLLGAFRG